MSDGWTVGPTISISIREVPEADLAEVSNTTYKLVVVLCSCTQRPLEGKILLLLACEDQQLVPSQHIGVLP